MARWPIVELASSINIPQWHLTKVQSRRIGNKKQIKLTKTGESDGFLTSTWSQLHSMNAKAGEHRRSEPCGLDVTISAIFTTSLESQESYLTLRNLTLQTDLSITRD